MKELLEAISKDDFINANSIITEILKAKVKEKLDQKKKDTAKTQLEPVHVDSFDVKDDGQDHVHEGSYSPIKARELVSRLKASGCVVYGSGRGEHDKYGHPEYPELGKIAIPRGRGDITSGVHRVAQQFLDDLENLKRQNQGQVKSKKVFA